LGTNEWSAIATAAAAVIAACVWVHGICKSSIGQRRRISASIHLMVEELARASSHAVEVWRIVNARNFSGAELKRFSIEVDSGLRVHRAENLALEVESLPDELGVALAKFISSADMLRNSYAIVVRSLIEDQGGLTVNNVQHLVALTSLSGMLIDQALALASELESASGAQGGVITKRVATLALMEGRGA